jgi:prephenate dehydrogenase
MFRQVTIIGPGLLGGSLSLAVKKMDISEELVIWARSENSLNKAVQTFPFARIEKDLQESVRGSDFIIICTPVETIGDVLQQIKPFIDENSLVTDVGSIKGSICNIAQETFGDSRASFIGSHPMAGSEKSGMEFSDPMLFMNRACILTPMDNVKESDLLSLRKFWEKMGMIVQILDPSSHDKIIADLSHLPHLISSILAHSLASKQEAAQKVGGQGLADTTRIAEGDANLWSNILLENKKNLIQALQNFKRSLDSVELSLEEGDIDKLRDFLEEGKEFRHSLQSK